MFICGGGCGCDGGDGGDGGGGGGGVQLLGEVILERSNFSVMMRYISEPSNLVTMMRLLKDSSKVVQFEAFHVFKVFVANPNKSAGVLEILESNRDRLIKFLQGFKSDRGIAHEYITFSPLVVTCLLPSLR